jgi:pyruvate carboxylase
VISENVFHAQGYGFLSENATFVDICKDHGIDFIGPTSTHINIMGDKSTARDTMKVILLLIDLHDMLASTKTLGTIETRMLPLFGCRHGVRGWIRLRCGDFQRVACTGS